MALTESQQQSFLMEDGKVGAIVGRSSLSMIKSANCYLRIMVIECRSVELVLRISYIKFNYLDFSWRVQIIYGR